VTRRARLLAAAAVAATAAWWSAPRNGAAAGDDTVSVQLLAINDLHGNLEPPAGASGQVNGRPAGGIVYLATHLRQALRDNPNSIFVAAGDLVGASPAVSAFFHDEPTIEAMNALGLAVSSVGNHEFDEGMLELLRMQNGRCHPVDGCQDHDGFAGATFKYLAANVVRAVNGRAVPLFPATVIRTVGGVKIGFIGETLKGTPREVTPSGVRGLTFLDEASTANRYAAQLRQRGVHAIVLLIHEGGEQNAEGAADPNRCDNFNGGIVPIVRKLSPDIDVVVSGHTHRFYVCTIDGHLVTSAGSYGRLITRIRLDVSRVDGSIVKASAENEIVTRDVPADPAEARIVEKYARLAAPMAHRVVGSITGDIARRTNSAGESPLGDLIADAQLAATRESGKGGAVAAFMNPGGIRTELTADHQSANERPGEITYDELFTVQPFGNVLTVITLSGDAVMRVLEQQFDNPTAGATKILQVSQGFSYRYRLNAPPGQHVDRDSITIQGGRVTPTGRVRIAVNNFLATGGDGFSAFTEGTMQVGGPVDVDALAAYFKARSPVAPRVPDRIVRTD
jgi:5'-nucleotidase